MNAVLAFLTSRKTTFVAFVFGITLLFADSMFVEEMQKLGIPDSVVGRLISLAKLTAMALTALGYSPLKRPDTPEPPTTP